MFNRIMSIILKIILSIALIGVLVCGVLHFTKMETKVVETKVVERIINNDLIVIVNNSNKGITDITTTDETTTIRHYSIVEPYYENTEYTTYTLKYLANAYNENMRHTKDMIEGKLIEIPCYLTKVCDEYAIIVGTYGADNNSYKCYAYLNGMAHAVDTYLDTNGNGMCQMYIRGRVIDVGNSIKFEMHLKVDEILVK